MNNAETTQPMTPVKVTHQNAPLEAFLTRQRTKRIFKDVRGKCVLDFGCGAHLTTLKAIEGLASFRVGMDIRFRGKGPMEAHPGIFVVGSFEELDLLCAQKNIQVDCVVSLACFEHLEPEEFLDFLTQLKKRTTADTKIVGTVPTPLAKPVIEFLSYKLGLIDPSQIRDHKVYYNRALLDQTIRQAGWELHHYRTFQFGMNSYFHISQSASR